jgi:tubulysin polyketide synthase-like protein
MSAYDLLSDLRQAGVVVKASGNDRLVVDAPKGALTPELRAALAEHKKELLAILSVTGQQPVSASSTLPRTRAESEEVARPEAASSRLVDNRLEQMATMESPENPVGSIFQNSMPTAAQDSSDTIEDKIRRLEQEAAQLRAQQEARRAEIETRQRLDNEIKKLQEEAAQVEVIEEARRSERAAMRAAAEEGWQSAVAAHKKAADEAGLRQSEEERRAAQLEARRHAEEEIARRRSEEEIRKVEEQLASLRAAEVNRRAEVTERWQAEDERWRAESENRRAADEQAARQFADTERQRVDAEAKYRAEDEAARNSAETRVREIKEQVARLQAEQESYRAGEARRKAEEGARKADEETRQRAEEEARLKAAKEAKAEEEARLKAAEEARELAKEEARRQAEDEARRADEAARIAEQEARLRALEEERRQLEEQSRQQAKVSASKTEPEWFHLDVNEREDDQQEASGSSIPRTLPPVHAGSNADSEGTFIDYQEFESALQLHPTANFPSGKTPTEDFHLLDADHRQTSAEIAPYAVSNATLNMLGSESVNERSAAVAALPQLGGEDAFTHISAAFDDPAVEVRNAAARAMFSFQTDRAASFTRALREGAPERRRRIGAALASSGLATEAIGNLTGESREKTYDAFSLLFLMSKAGEVQPLLRAIEEHSNIEVRLAVVKLLALSGQHEILPAFRRLAVRGSLPPEVRSSVMEAIYQISSQASADAHSAA